MKPIYLFADSQLLFWADNGRLFLERLREEIPRSAPKAAYIGASNGDDPQFYSIFEAAMAGIDVRDHRMIPSCLSLDDEAFVKEADIILLAGGDAVRGWNVLAGNGLKDLLIKKYKEGCLLIGISAGAVQLGLFGLAEAEHSSSQLVDMFKLVPFMIGVHESKQEWKSLSGTIRLLDGTTKGIGISSGGGMIYYPDQSLEAIRFALTEFSIENGAVRNCLLAPQQSDQRWTRPFGLTN